MVLLFPQEKVFLSCWQSTKRETRRVGRTSIQCPGCCRAEYTLPLRLCHLWIIWSSAPYRLKEKQLNRKLMKWYMQGHACNGVQWLFKTWMHSSEQHFLPYLLMWPMTTSTGSATGWQSFDKFIDQWICIADNNELKDSSTFNISLTVIWISPFKTLTRSYDFPRDATSSRGVDSNRNALDLSVRKCKSAFFLLSNSPLAV